MHVRRHGISHQTALRPFSAGAGHVSHFDTKCGCNRTVKYRMRVSEGTIMCHGMRTINRTGKWFRSLLADEGRLTRSRGGKVLVLPASAWKLDHTDVVSTIHWIS